MAISRPFLLALLGAALLGATVLAVSSARSGSDNDAAPAAVQSDPAQAPAQTPAQTAPADSLRAALNLGAVKSARFDARLGVGKANAQSGAGKATVLRVSGAFARTDAGGLPDLKVRLSAGGVSGGFVSVGGKAWFVRGDTGWRMPAALWTPVEQNSPLNVNPSTWVRDVKSEGTETVGGVETEHVSATIDPQAVVADLERAAGQTGGEPPKGLGRAVKSGELDAWVGSDDNILRRLSVQLTTAGDSKLRLDVRLSDVNDPQQIEAPAHVRAGAPAGAFGALAQSLSGNLGRASGAESSSLAVLTSPNPGRAARAVRKHKKVVILFRNPRGLDDRAMASVMRSVDQRTKALVLTDEVGAVERYGELVEDLGVSQTPSIVIIDRKGKARLIEGYVDSNTLTQAVADAR
jgi:hypothetical protein